MHESHIVENLIAQAIRAADGRRVKRVHVALGQLSDLSPDALEFYFEALHAETALAEACLVIRVEPGRARCSNCGDAFEMSDEFTACPACGTLRREIIGGNGLALEAFDVE